MGGGGGRKAAAGWYRSCIADGVSASKSVPFAWIFSASRIGWCQSQSHSVPVSASVSGSPASVPSPAPVIMAPISVISTIVVHVLCTRIPSLAMAGRRRPLSVHSFSRRLGVPARQRFLNAATARVRQQMAGNWEPRSADSAARRPRKLRRLRHERFRHMIIYLVASHRANSSAEDVWAVLRQSAICRHLGAARCGPVRRGGGGDGRPAPPAPLAVC